MTEDEKLLPAIDLRLTPVVTKDEAVYQLKQFQEFCKGYLVPEQDFGVIPGTKNEVLLQPGAQKLAEMYGFYPHYTILDKTEDWTREPYLFDYTVECVLKRRADNIIVGASIGSCNSYEGRYRWREAKRLCPECNQPSIAASKKEWGGGFYCNQKLGGCGKSWKSEPYKDKKDKLVHPHPDDIRVCNLISQQTVGKVPNDDIAAQKNTILKMAEKRAYVGAVISATRSSGIFTQDVEDFVASVVVKDSKLEPSVDKETGEVIYYATKEDLRELTTFAKQYGIDGSETQQMCLALDGVDKDKFFSTFTLSHLALVKAQIIERDANKQFVEVLEAEDAIPF